MVKQSKLEEMSKLKKIAPGLSKIGKEHSFTIPDNYFDDFYARLHNRLEAEKNTLPQPRNRIIRILKPVLSLAASFALIFLLVYWPIKSFLPNYLARTKEIYTPIHDDDPFNSIIEKIDENSFFALITEPYANDQSELNELSDEELLSYLSFNVSEYEIYLQTEN